MKEKLKIYISGPMTGLPGFNYQAFNEKEEELIACGHDVINPAKTGEIDVCNISDPEWHDFMISAISRMRDATAISYLDGWENSYGARIESIVAEKMELRVV